MTTAIVVGAGIIGRAVAWRLATRGVSVTIVDPDPAQAAARVAAGMLAPVTEAHFGQEALLQLNVAGAQVWPEFAAELQAADLNSGFAPTPTLAVARNADDMAELDHLASYLHDLGLAADRLTGREIRRLEPGLGPRTRGGYLVPGDHQVDPRQALAALTAAAAELAVAEIAHRVRAVAVDRVELGDGRSILADHVVVCAGWAAGRLVDVPVRPVKGQIIRLAATDRAVMPVNVLRGRDVYVVPRAGGEIVVGATTEELTDTATTAGAARVLLEEAWRLVPGLDEAELVELSAGLRPATPDGAPVLATIDGVHVAVGHHRNGVLLAPITADLVAAAVVDGRWPDLARPFGADRFALAEATR